MPIVSGGGTTPAAVATSGKVIPVAAPSGVTVNTTTYDNTVTGSGKITTLIIGDTVAFAFAKAGDAFPRVLVLGDPTDGFFWLGDGTFDAYAHGAALYTPAEGQMTAEGLKLTSIPQEVTAAISYAQVSPKWGITSGALATQQLVSTTGAQINTGRDVETQTPVTSDNTANAATCKVELSPDNVTYSTIGTVTIASAAVNTAAAVTGMVSLRVPAGWYIKLTTTHAALGLTTPY